MGSNQKRKFLLAVLVLIVWAATAALGIYRSGDGSNDFDTFYTAGKSVLDKTGIYYVGDYYQMRPDIGPFLYPPIAACFFSLFAFFPISIAAVLWVTFLLAIFIGSLFLTFQILGLKREERAAFFEATPIRERLFLFFVGTVFLIDNLAMMQINILVFFLCLLSVLFWQKKQSMLAGMILSAAIFLKLTPILFCLYFLTKKAWKIMLGVLIGSLIWSVVIPTLFFGLENNRIYHRQWFGRMIKPSIIDVLNKIKPEDTHPRKKSLTEMRHLAADEQFIDTNQSLEAALTRLLSKDRFEHYVTHRYKKLPVLGGGISREKLGVLLSALKLALLAVCVYLWARRKDITDNLKIALEISLVFLTMTLLSPVTRSHYYVVWIFAYLTLFLVRYRMSGHKRLSESKFFFQTANLSACLYLLLALPYGEAVGMGAWANLIFWVGCVHQFKISGQSV